VVGFLLMTFWVSTAFAETAWYTCSVDMAGPGKVETFIALTDQAADPVFSGKWFLFPVDRAREMLAVALTAINGDKQVIVVVDTESATYPDITDIYLKAQ
jgi:hypothetical protein